MINLDAYINNSTEVILDGETYRVKEPGIDLYFKLNNIEKDLKDDNYFEKRLETALMFINHNEEGKKISRDQLSKVPIEGIEDLVKTISSLRLQAEKDPN